MLPSIIVAALAFRYYHAITVYRHFEAELFMPLLIIYAMFINTISLFFIFDFFTSADLHVTLLDIFIIRHFATRLPGTDSLISTLMSFLPISICRLADVFRWQQDTEAVDAAISDAAFRLRCATLLLFDIASFYRRHATLLLDACHLPRRYISFS